MWNYVNVQFINTSRCTACLESLFARRSLTPVDILATVTALTAEIVAAEVKRHGIGTVIASGGGCANPTLMAMLRSRLDDVRVTTSDALGASPDAKDAIAFALLANTQHTACPAMSSRSTVPSNCRWVLVASWTCSMRGLLSG